MKPTGHKQFIHREIGSGWWWNEIGSGWQWNQTKRKARQEEFTKVEDRVLYDNNVWELDLI